MCLPQCTGWNRKGKCFCLGGSGGGGGRMLQYAEGGEEFLYQSILNYQEINVENWQVERFESYNFLSKNSYLE